MAHAYDAAAWQAHPHPHQMVESALKGAILVYSKEAFNNTFLAMGISPGLAGALAGAGGGACQVSIMGPCTFLVTGKVTGDPNESTMQRIQRTYRTQGIGVRRGGCMHTQPLMSVMCVHC